MKFFKKHEKETPATTPATDSTIDFEVVDEKKIHFSRKTWLILIGSVLAVILIVVLVFALKARKNDGDRIAAKLADNLGSSVSSAESKANVDLYGMAKCDDLNDLDEFDLIYESVKEIKVGGVHIPQWAILCNTATDGSLGEVIYYNFSLLKKETAGVKKKGYLGTSEVLNGMKKDAVSEILDMEPFKIAYFDDNTEQHKYKYCYKEKGTGDLKSYCITVLYGADDTVTAVLDKPVNFIADDLKVD